MSPSTSGAGGVPLLNGLFGSLQQAAINFQDTAAVWTTLRQNAGLWVWQSQGGGPTPSDAELQSLGAQALSQAGVGIQQVNSYRALAGEWRTAQGRLSSLEPGQQITAGDVFVPPWAKTDDPAVPSEYRIRVEWQIQPTVGESFTAWGAYELGAPLTSVADALSQAQALAGRKPTSPIPDPAQIAGAASYEIEQV